MPRRLLDPTDNPGVAAQAAEVAPMSPAARDYTVDFLRGIAILAVAIGHWLVVVPSYANGHFDGVNALGSVPLMHRLTWVFQVMPLFFVLGGFANAMSWRSSRSKGISYAEWLRTRLVRLARPSAALFAAWAAAGVALRLLGVDATFVHSIAWLAVVPIWFLAVYVIVVALAPALLAAHTRWGWRAIAVLAVAATIVDAGRITGRLGSIAYLNFFFVFLFAQQLGFFWVDGRLGSHRWQPWAMFVGGVVTLVLLTHVGPYPVSLVGVPGAGLANNAPPTITLIALGVAQAGLGLLGRDRISKWLDRPRLAGATVAINLHAMTILLWHFTALVLVAVILLPLGLVPVFPSGSGAWWAVRVATVAVCGLALVGVVKVTGRFERAEHASARHQAGDGVAATAKIVAATAMFAASFAMITVRGLSDASTVTGIPIVALGVFATASVLAGTSGRDQSNRKI